MSDNQILVERNGQVTTIRLNNPGTMNALTTQIVRQLRELVRSAEKDSRAILLAGSERAFCAGANLTDDAAIAVDGQFDAGLGLEDDVNPLMMSLRDLSVPLVTAVRGVAAGVGASLALMGDLVVAGQGAYFLQAFCRVGLVPDGGSPWLLTKSIGRIRAMELMLLGEKLSAQKAMEWGLITRMVADSEVESTALALAQQLAAGPTTALALTRKIAWAAAESSYEAQLRLERHAQRTASFHPDFAEGVAAFRGKRAARFGQDQLPPSSKSNS